MAVDVSKLDAAWRASWSTTDPDPRAVSSRFPDACAVFRHVADPPYYMTSREDDTEVWRRYRTLVSHFLRASGEDSLILVACGWSSGTEPVPLDHYLADLLPDAVLWRSIPWAGQHVYASAASPDDPAVRDVVLRAVEDLADGVMLLDATGTWAVHPDLRSMIVLTREPELLRQVTDAHPDWHGQPHRASPDW